MVFDQGTARVERVAVIGSGIAGLSAAWLTARRAHVTLFEAEPRLGGHANTLTITHEAHEQTVDTGFIVYNERNYPNLTALFRHLDVPTLPSDMSFAASLDGGAFEYSGSGIKGLLGQKANVVRSRFWRMVADILRFYRAAPATAARADLAGVSLGDYLDSQGFGAAFINDHLLPMGAAIWSASAADIRAYPLHAFLRFFINHGLTELKNRPRWRTVAGGSRSYVERLTRDFLSAQITGTIRLGCPVAAIARTPSGVTLTTKAGDQANFDAVVIATHADQALTMLSDADAAERQILGAFRYTSNTAVLHWDRALMPRRKAVWASWNYIGERGSDHRQPLCVSYWMNALQGIESVDPLIVTLNPSRPIAADKVLATIPYTHPAYDHQALTAQGRLGELQGRRNTWFCGAYFGNGFHEDGIAAGLAAAEALTGERRPWTLPQAENAPGAEDVSISAPVAALP